MSPEPKSAAPGDLPVRLVGDALSEGVAVLCEGRIVFANAQLCAWAGAGAKLKPTTANRAMKAAVTCFTVGLLGNFIQHMLPKIRQPRQIKNH